MVLLVPTGQTLECSLRERGKPLLSNVLPTYVLSPLNPRTIPSCPQTFFHAATSHVMSPSAFLHERPVPHFDVFRICRVLSHRCPACLLSRGVLPPALPHFLPTSFENVFRKLGVDFFVLLHYNR